MTEVLDAERSMASGRHVSVGGIPIFDGGMDDAVDVCLRRIAAGAGGRVATANLDFLALARANFQLQLDLATSDLVVADGMPVVWLARLAGARRVSRVPGVDLVRRLCEAAPSLGGLRVAMYGSSPDIADPAAAALRSSFPKVETPVVCCPPFGALSPEQHESHIELIRQARPHVVLVALGCPAQERFIAAAAPQIPGAVWVGVGGTFDFFAGRRRRAPGTVQRLGLEWTVRMAQEPRRLGKRYLLRDLPALARLAPRCALHGIRDRENRPGVAAP